MVNQLINNKPGSKLKLLLLLVFIIFAVLLIVLNKAGKKEEKKQVSLPAVVIPTPVVLSEGSFSIQSISTEISVATDKTREIDILASSNQKTIVAYDLVISYEKNALEILAVESLLPDFKVYPLEKSNHFIITGVKEIESKASSVFDNLPIVRLKVIPKKTSDLTLKIVNSLGNEKSQMVDEESKILRPETGEFKLNIN